MKSNILLAILLGAAAVNAATIKDVKFSCEAKGCQVAFQFASDKDLPTFYQKYDGKTKKLTVGFSETSFALGEGEFKVDENSPWIRTMNVSKGPYRGLNFLKIEMDVGGAMATDKNEIALNKADFLLKVKGKDGKAWTLSKLFADRQKAAEKQAALDKKAAEKAALEEKKRLAEEKKAAEKQAAAEKKAAEKQALLDKKAAEKAAAEEKKRLEAEKKAAEKQAALDKKAAEKAALEEKKRLAEEKKAAEKQALLDKKAAEKAAKEEEKRLAEEQKKLDKALQQGGAVSVLLPGIKEMTVLIGSGMEQFRLAMDNAVQIKNVLGPDKNGVITIASEGPQKSPVFKISTGSLVKSVTWGQGGLKIQLASNMNPVMLVQEGALVLQVAEDAISKEGMIFWSARPTGIVIRNWMKGKDDKPDFDKFVNKFEEDSKKLVSNSQTFHLRPVIRELIVVNEEIELLGAPSESAPVIQRLVFGDRLISLDASGLFTKVQSGTKVGYVNRRSVSFIDELSSIQLERVKQLDKERGENLPEGAAPISSALDALYENRVTYSSFGRRDPFIEIKGLVEDGINIDQVELVGIIWESDVPMAILVEAKNPSVSYTVKEGDKILNGKVLKITQTDVLFLIQEFGVSRRYSMGLPDKFGGQK